MKAFGLKLRIAEWHDMCADRVHAGVIKWAGKIPPEQKDQPGSSGRGESGVRQAEKKGKKEKTTMKKLMTFAAVAAMTYVGSAVSLTPSVCTDCGAYGASDCDTIVFKVTGSGKAVVPKGGYKATTKIKIKKGALALEGEYCALTDTCCYETGWFYATIKAGKKTFALATPVDIKVWSLFGKNLDRSRSFGSSIKKGKSVCLESALYVEAADDSAFWAGDVDLEDAGIFKFYASAFGKVDMKVSNGKGGAGYCSEEKGCTPIYTPKSYSGWFVGYYDCVGMEDCFRCSCEAIDVFGGTWKAKFNKKATTLSSAASIAGVSANLGSDE